METPDAHTLPELMSIADVAVWLRKSVKAVRNMRSRGLLPAPIRVPGMQSLLWKRSDLSHWLQAAESRSRHRKTPTVKS